MQKDRGVGVDTGRDRYGERERQVEREIERERQVEIGIVRER